jgi:hypothetical protein
MKQVDRKSRRERKSHSAVILCILEEYFERDKKLGQILVDLCILSETGLSTGLDLQKSKFKERLLGDILVDAGLVEERQVEDALMIQKRD